MAISKKISELDVLTSPQDLTKLFPPLFAQDGSPLNIRMSMAEVLKSARQVTITDATVGTSTSILSIAPTWTTNGTYAAPLLVNVTDSGTANAASKLLDLQVGGSSKAYFAKSGALHIPGAPNGGNALFLAGTNYGLGYYSNGLHLGNTNAPVMYLTVTDVNLATSAFLQWSSSGWSGAPDLAVGRDAADILCQRRDTNGQSLKVYRTYTSSSTFERGTFGWHDSSSDTGTVGNVLRIGTEKGSVGGTARNVSIVANGSDRLIIKPDNDHVLIGNLRSSAVSTYDLGMSGVPWRTVFANKIALGASDMVAIEHQSNLIRVTNNSTGPGVFAIDNVQGTNFERLKAEWDTNVARFGTSKGGSGTARDFAIITDNTVRVTFAAAGGQTAADGHNMAFGTSTGTKIGTATGQKIGFWNATPVVQQVLATGAGATVDNVITLLQTLGLCKQS